MNIQWIKNNNKRVLLFCEIILNQNSFRTLGSRQVVWCRSVRCASQPPRYDVVLSPIVMTSDNKTRTVSKSEHCILTNGKKKRKSHREVYSPTFYLHYLVIPMIWRGGNSLVRTISELRTSCMLFFVLEKKSKTYSYKPIIIWNFVRRRYWLLWKKNRRKKWICVRILGITCKIIIHDATHCFLILCVFYNSASNCAICSWFCMVCQLVFFVILVESYLGDYLSRICIHDYFHV